jgi:curved DNA-binding protein CbpA
MPGVSPGRSLCPGEGITLADDTSDTPVELGMQDASAADYYEALQISPNADTDMVSRVYRLLAQRFHPDNRETGDSERFRRVHEAYSVLSDPERRAQYDVHYQRQRHLRVKLVSSTGHVDTDFEYEQAVRLTVLEILYTHRRTDSREPGLFDRELETMVGRPLEQLEFTFWYLMQRNLIRRGEQSRIVITVEGVDFLEQHVHHHEKKRLHEHIKAV